MSHQSVTPNIHKESICNDSDVIGASKLLSRSASEPRARLRTSPVTLTT